MDFFLVLNLMLTDQVIAYALLGLENFKSKLTGLD